MHCARKTLILRESLREQAEYAYVADRYLDEGCDLRVYVNAYPIAEVVAFMQSYGFAVTKVEDRRTRGQPEMVIDYPHYWTFLVAEH
jgi:hypothetical protein